MGLYPRQVPAFERSHKHGANIAVLVIIVIEITIKHKTILFLFLLRKFNSANFSDYGDKAITCKSIPYALELIAQMQDQVERVWIIGGSRVYEVFHANRM